MPSIRFADRRPLLLWAGVHAPAILTAGAAGGVIVFDAAIIARGYTVCYEPLAP